MLNLVIIQIPCYALLFWLFHSEIDPSKLGYTIFSVTSAIQFTIQTAQAWATFETSMVSFERCYYFEKILPEVGYTSFEDESND